MPHRSGGSGNKHFFLDKLLIGDDCWEWQARRNAWGYGTFKLNRSPPHLPPDWTTALAHRLSYERFVAPIPSGMLVCHRCNNPACVRPDHLYLGTNTENMRDRNRIGKQGKKLTPELAAQIRADTGKPTEIARRFGITYGMVWLIKKGLCWPSQEAI